MTPYRTADRQVICFPIYMAFVASTVTQPENRPAAVPLLPGSHCIENLHRGADPELSMPRSTGESAELQHHGDGHRGWKIVISIISHTSSISASSFA
ncbi:MAG: hypothetical protein HPM95_17210 [Alphaproteobacteria bacterium]|nr:hypothetical protein [Alphaproteobacteria bacterium]